MIDTAFQACPDDPDGNDAWLEEPRPQPGFLPSPEWHLLQQNETYAAYARDLDFMWRWVIVKDSVVIQEGCSLSLQSSIHAVTHVLNYFGITERRPRDVE
jgi:methane monooxygenase component D